MALRARLALGLSAAALVAGALWTWGRAPDARPARPRAESEHVAAIAAGPAALDEDATATADVRLEEARSEPGSRRAIAEGISIGPEERADTPFGKLRVHVRSRDTGEPLAGVRVFLEPAGGDLWSTTRSDGARGPSGKSLVTGDDGLVELEAPLGEDCVLKATRLGVYDDTEEARVSAFSGPETRDIVLEFPTAYDLPFVGRVVASEDDEPLRGASFSIGGFIRGSTDADGYFEVLVPSWQMFWVMVEAPGHARAITETRRGHGSRAEARVIRLHRSAGLTALVLARDGTPLEGVRVHLSTDSRNLSQGSSGGDRVGLWDIEWTGRTGSDGRCSVGDLPPLVPLEVDCSQAAGFRRRERDPLHLSPGEVREVVFRIGSGATIAGRLIDAGGEDAEGVPVWLEPAEADVPGYFRAYRNPMAETVTAAGGWFELADVSDGTWWVGPAPGGLYPPRAEVVEVVGGLADRTVLLHATRGLFLGGRVVDPAGAPIEEAWIDLEAEGEPLPFWFAGRTDAEGQFSVGPLERGAYAVSAGGSRWPRSAPMRVEAGQRDVLIQLQLGGALRGKLVDVDTGAPERGEVLAVAAVGATRLRTTWADEAGGFDLVGLEAGLYHVSATTESGEFALETNVAVAAGALPSDILLRARPGATLRARYEGPRSRGWFRVLVGDAIVATGGGEPGELDSQVVPAGPLRVECFWEGREAPEVHEMTLAAGEERELAFGAE